MNSATLTDLVGFLQQLQSARIHYELRHSTPKAIMVCVTVPGERWEIEFHDDGDVEVEIFRSVRGVEQASARLKELFARFSD